MNLYLVTLKGFNSSNHKISYVISNDPTDAYNRVRNNLEDRDYGYDSDRALYKIELLAEDKEYPDCETRLYA